MLVVLKQLKAQQKSLAPKTQTLENSCSDTIVGGGFIVKVVYHLHFQEWKGWAQHWHVDAIYKERRP
jgi:hypothetical protein